MLCKRLSRWFQCVARVETQVTSVNNSSVGAGEECWTSGACGGPEVTAHEPRSFPDLCAWVVGRGSLCFTHTLNIIGIDVMGYFITRENG